MQASPKSVIRRLNRSCSEKQGQERSLWACFAHDTNTAVPASPPKASPSSWRRTSTRSPRGGRACRGATGTSPAETAATCLQEKGKRFASGEFRGENHSDKGNRPLPCISMRTLPEGKMSVCVPAGVGGAQRPHSSDSATTFSRLPQI